MSCQCLLKAARQFEPTIIAQYGVEDEDMSGSGQNLKKMVKKLD